MKKWLERLKDAFYGILPFLLLFGIPLAICIVIGVISIWDDIPKILSSISNIGNGSLIWGVILLLFGLIGLINTVIAFMLWVKAFFKLLEKKTKSTFWFWFAIITVTFGWFALFHIIKMI